MKPPEAFCFESEGTTPYEEMDDDDPETVVAAEAEWATAEKMRAAIPAAFITEEPRLVVMSEPSVRTWRFRQPGVQPSRPV